MMAKKRIRIALALIVFPLITFFVSDQVLATVSTAGYWKAGHRVQAGEVYLPTHQRESGASRDSHFLALAAAKDPHITVLLVSQSA